MQDLNPFSEVEILVQTRNQNLLNVVKVVCAAFGVRRMHDCSEASELAETFEKLKPDLLISGLSGEVEAQLDAMRALRRHPSCPNRYFPAIVVSPYTERRWVMAAINAGAHEFVALPVSPKRLWLAINHAVIIGRPFVDVEGYFGPCRRRRVDRGYKGPERRADGSSPDPSVRKAQEAVVGEMMAEWNATKAA